MGFIDKLSADMLMTVVIGVLTAAAIYVGARKDKKIAGMSKFKPVLGFLVLAGVLAFNAGFLVDLGLGEQPAAIVSGTTTTGPGVGGACAVEDTTVTLSAINAFTSSATAGNHRYKINSNPARVVADAGTFTASPGDKIQILWGNETDGNYFGAVTTETIPCAGTATFSTELYQNGTVTIEVFNEEGNLLSQSGENESVAAGDVVTLTAKLKGTFQRGQPNGGVIVAEYNGTGTSLFDDVIVDFGGSEVPTPSFYTVRLGINAKTKTYSVPAIISNDILVGSIVLDVDDSNNPPGNTTWLTYYPYDYFINEDTGGSFDGPAVEDEDDAQTFVHATEFALTFD